MTTDEKKKVPGETFHSDSVYHNSNMNSLVELLKIKNNWGCACIFMVEVKSLKIKA